MKPVLSCYVLSSRRSPPTTTDSPTGNRTTPPTINSVSPRGAPRGATTELTVEGLNLGQGQRRILQPAGHNQARILRIKELPDRPDVRLGSNGGISTVDVGPLPPRNEVTLELDISPDADIGPGRFSFADAARNQSTRALPD